MVKKIKITNPVNPDHIESIQEIQLNNLAKINDFEKRIEASEEKLAATEEKFKRILADYQNQERRHKEQESQIIKMASASLLEKLLLDIDALKMAEAHLKDKGLQMVIDKLENTLSKEGLVVIKTDNENFDPLIMDCTEVVSGPKDKVVETISTGYYLFDKVLRTAKVKVGTGIL